MRDKYEYHDLVGENLIKSEDFIILLILHVYFFPYLGIQPSELSKSIQWARISADISLEITPPLLSAITILQPWQC
jgi:hypothetical protein